MEILTTEQVRDFSADGLSGYEVRATFRNKKSSETGRLYATMLFTEKDAYYLLVGMHNDAGPDFRADFQKIARTFKRRQ